MEANLNKYNKFKHSLNLFLNQEILIIRSIYHSLIKIEEIKPE